MPGTLTLAGANTFTNTVTLNIGTLNLNNSAALGTGTLNFITTGGIIDNTSGGALVLNNNPQTWNADFTFNGTSRIWIWAPARLLSPTTAPSPSTRITSPSAG